MHRGMCACTLRTALSEVLFLMFWKPFESLSEVPWRSFRSRLEVLRKFLSGVLNGGNPLKHPSVAFQSSSGVAKCRLRAALLSQRVLPIAAFPCPQINLSTCELILCIAASLISYCRYNLACSFSSCLLLFFLLAQARLLDSLPLVRGV